MLYDVHGVDTMFLFLLVRLALAHLKNFILINPSSSISCVLGTS